LAYPARAVVIDVMIVPPLMQPLMGLAFSVSQLHTTRPSFGFGLGSLSAPLTVRREGPTRAIPTMLALPPQLEKGIGSHWP